MASHEQKEKLLRALKKEVKQMMEESVMLKTVHEDSGSVTSLCAIVDTCLSLGLKRRALGLFKTSSTTALIQKLAKEFEDARFVVEKVAEIEKASAVQKRAHSTGDSTSSSLPSKQKPGLLEKAQSGSNLAAITRFMWIRVALFEKRLQRIVAFLVEESDKYYSKDSLVADQDFGPILSSLLVGPCALQFSKVKAQGTVWSELPANELVQRHKISSCGSSSSVSSPSSASARCANHSPVTKNSSYADSPIKSRISVFSAVESPSHTSYRRSLSHTPSYGAGPSTGIPPGLARGVFFADDAICGGCRSIPFQAREYVESLHQNQWSDLIFGKNNVHVLPKDISTPVPGYLSLHQSLNGIALKWTPNQLMNGSTIEDKSVSWQYALNLELRTIHFIHCHQDLDDFGTAILVSNDGTQQPPIQFPPGGHMMQFLGCLETALVNLGGHLSPSVRQRLNAPPSQDQQQENSGSREQQQLSKTDSILGIKILPLSLIGKKKESLMSDGKSQSCDKPSDPSSTSTPSEDVDVKVSGGEEADEKQAENGVKQDCGDQSSFVDCIYKLYLPPPKVSTQTSTNDSNLLSVAQTPLSKVKSVEWLANLFSPNKSRHNSSSTERSFSLSECPDQAATDHPAAIEEEESIIEAEILHLGDKVESARVGLVLLNNPDGQIGLKKREASPSEPISTLCLTMRKQIISRAFYGWLAHVRHLRTVKKHLGGLAFEKPLVMEDPSWIGGITENWWTENLAKKDSNLEEDSNLIYKMIYFGGIEPHLRKKIWPFLLGHYKWRHSATDCAEIDRKTTTSYENKVSDWMAIEAIVRQKDREITAASIANAKMSESINNSVDNQSFNISQIHISNEVFESIDEALSSRTVSQDKISTITEATENSASNSDDKLGSRVKLLSTQSEPVSSTTTNENAIASGIRQLKNSFKNHFMSSESTEVSGFRANINSDEGIEDLNDGLVNLTPKKLVRQNETDDENGLDELSVKSIHSCSSRKSLTTNTSSSDTEGEDAVEGTSVSEDGRTCTGIAQKIIHDDIEKLSNGLTNGKSENVMESLETAKEEDEDGKTKISYKITTPSVDSGNPSECSPLQVESEDPIETMENFEHDLKQITRKIYSLGVSKDDTLSYSSTCHSPASEEAGGIYPQELIENFALNLHRIDKDVERCDRNLTYFLSTSNLDKLRNIITTYVWENLDIGYMQGMCDLVAPLLVTFDDEALTHACFTKLMERMIANFPTGNQMDENFSNMRSLIQVLDQSLHDTIQQNGDFSHFYFCYRWFLLDFKREFSYSDTYLVWETIWASRFLVSSQFFLFVALAMVENYRDIILDRNMDFTDIIKFFNEMAEKHDAKQILIIARELVMRLQYLLSDE